MSRNGLSSLWRCLPIPSRCSSRRKEKNDHHSQQTNELHHVPVPIDEVEEYRQRGQAILRALLTPQAAAAVAVEDDSSSNTNKHVLSSSSSLQSSSSLKAATTVMYDTGMTRQHYGTGGAKGGNRVSNNRRQEYDVDWAAVIQKANEIQEEEKERTRRTSDNNSTTRNENNSKILHLKKMKRALERRRKYDEDGSFSVNMLTYRTADDTQPAALPFHQKLQAVDHRDDEPYDVNNHHRHHHHRHSSLSDTSSQSTSTSLASTGTAMAIIREDNEYESSC